MITLLYGSECGEGIIICWDNRDFRDMRYSDDREGRDKRDGSDAILPGKRQANGR